MSIRSLIHDMRFSRSQRVVHDRSAAASPAPDTDAGESPNQGFWAHMPPDLLRDVLMRIEASEGAWPPRKSVVACAGVCRSWRVLTREIVKSPELSGKLTFPISVKQPGPREELLRCFIKRNHSTHTYYLYLGLTHALTDEGKFLLAARNYKRPTCTDYVISLNGDDMSKGSSNYIGKLRSNFLGTKFTIFDGQPTVGAKFTKSRSTRLVNLKQVSPKVPAGNYPVAHISYELNMLGSRVRTSRGPRRMQCTMDGIPASSIQPGEVAPTQADFSSSTTEFFPSLPFFRSKSTRLDSLGSSAKPKDEVIVLRNKAPRWHEQLQCWCLNFHGRVTVASVKNFQLVASPENGPVGPEHEKIVLQFGKVGKDLFTMDFRSNKVGKSVRTMNLLARKRSSQLHDLALVPALVGVPNFMLLQ